MNYWCKCHQLMITNRMWNSEIRQKGNYADTLETTDCKILRWCGCVQRMGNLRAKTNNEMDSLVLH